jgi:hypothetical protein
LGRPTEPSLAHYCRLRSVKPSDAKVVRDLGNKSAYCSVVLHHWSRVREESFWWSCEVQIETSRYAKDTILLSIVGESWNMLSQRWRCLIIVACRRCAWPLQLEIGQSLCLTVLGDSNASSATLGVMFPIGEARKTWTRSLKQLLSRSFRPPYPRLRDPSAQCCLMTF